MTMNAVTAILIAAISFSFYPLLNTLVMANMSPYLLALSTQLVTFIISLGYLFYTLKSFSKIRDLMYLFFKLPFDTILIPILSGTGIFAGGLFFISSLSMMSKAGATLIMESWPLMAIVVARALLTHKKWQPFRPLDLILILIALLGMMFITSSEVGVSFDDFIDAPFAFFQNQNFEGIIGIILAVLSALCFAWAGVSRTYFASILPEKMRIHFFGQKDSLSEANFTYMLTYLFGIPSAIFCFFIFEGSHFEFNIISLLPIMLLGCVLTITSMFYAYGLIIANNANVNLLWYIAPLLATVWLVIFGYSAITPLLIVGGFLIILSNIILIMTNREKASSQIDGEINV
jgi:drug/metabolite transporter (DMT)-like permease